MSAGETRVLRLDPCDDIAAGAAQIATALDSEDLQGGEALAAASYLRIEQPLPKTTAPPWLRAQAPLPRFYWSNRDGSFELAGAGVAEEVQADDFETLDGLVARFASGDAATEAAVFGTARFDIAGEPATEWADFKRVYLQVPLLELRNSMAGTTLAVNLKVAGGLESGRFDAQRRIAAKAVRRVEIDGTPERGPWLPITGGADIESWRNAVALLLEQVRSGRLDKVVLARREAYASTDPIDPLQLLADLGERRAPKYRFLVMPTPEVAFLGASPERLYRRDERFLRTEALAGTSARGETPDEDKQLVDALQASAKNAHEHDVVCRHIIDRLTPLAATVDDAAAPSVVSLPHLHHLHTPITAELKDDVGDAQVLAALHPTPAVCGMPAQGAMDFIRATEGFDRGLYGGLIGLFGRDQAEVAVAIRSALVRGSEVQLFAGAGIVDGSDADAEWEETVDKMKPFEASQGGNDVA